MTALVDEMRENPREMGAILREATRLVESSDLRGANEVLKKMDVHEPASVSARAGRERSVLAPSAKAEEPDGLPKSEGVDMT